MINNYRITDKFWNKIRNVLLVFSIVYFICAGSYNLFFRDKIAEDYAEFTQKLQTIATVNGYNIENIQPVKRKALISKKLGAEYKPVDNKNMDSEKSTGELKNYLLKNGFVIGDLNSKGFEATNDEYIVHFYLISKELNVWSVSIARNSFWERNSL